MIYRDKSGERLTADSYRELARVLRAAGFSEQSYLTWPVHRGIENSSCYRYDLLDRAVPGGWERALAKADKTIENEFFWLMDKKCGKKRPKRYIKTRAAQLTRRAAFWKRVYASAKPGHCCNCGKALPPRRRVWCSDDCSRAASIRSWWENTPQGWVASVASRAEKRCQYPGCEANGAHAHHIKPICDGGDPLDPDNGIYLCEMHHIETHRQIAASRRTPPWQGKLGL